MSEVICDNHLLHLRNDRISYIMAVLPGQMLGHLYFGPRLEKLNVQNILGHLGLSEADFSCQECALDRLPQEYPAFGLGDYREGALRLENPDGSTTADLRFLSAQQEEGKPGLPGLPATFGQDGKTLRVRLRDPATALETELLYTIFDACDAILRSARITNGGEAPLRVTGAMSLCLDLPDSGWDLITLNGAWARERSMYRRALMPGDQGVASRRGASSQQQSPFLALCRPDTSEAAGEALGAALIYSGNFSARVSVHQYGTARLLLGINDTDFSWRLKPGESFQTPEAALVYSREGMGGMSRQFHRLWENHLLPPRWVHAHRPVLLNSWEAAYFDFDEEKLVSIAACAARAGVELFVMDDGWFGRRNDDTSSLGDWQVNLQKLPGGLTRLGQRVRALGLQFGLWMEPEMVSPDSDLYRAHPEWSLHIPGREPITSRHQLILDLGRQDVQDFVFASVSRALRESGASYLKWDMNRNFTNIGSAVLPPEQQKEVPHRYILGLYAVLDRLVKAFPQVLIEGCAAGGGRFDAGILYYAPQFWCSDNTDALSRLKIQWGTSLVFPPSTMGSHVSAVPNHQTGRVTPLDSRFAVALGGCFGYELDPRKLTDAEQQALQGQIAYAKATEDTRLHGGLYRLLSPFAGNDTAYLSVSPDQCQAVFTLVRAQAQANVFPALIRLQGLNPRLRYRVRETGACYGGDELMQAGLCCSLPQGDAAALLYTLTAETP